MSDIQAIFSENIAEFVRVFRLRTYYEKEYLLQTNRIVESGTLNLGYIDIFQLALLGRDQQVISSVIDQAFDIIDAFPTILQSFTLTHKLASQENTHYALTYCFFRAVRIESGIPLAHFLLYLPQESISFKVLEQENNQYVSNLKPTIYSHSVQINDIAQLIFDYLGEREFFLDSFVYGYHRSFKQDTWLLSRIRKKFRFTESAIKEKYENQCAKKIEQLKKIYAELFASEGVEPEPKALSKFIKVWKSEPELDINEHLSGYTNYYLREAIRQYIPNNSKLENSR